MKTRSGYLIRRGTTYHAVWTIAGKKFMKTTGKTDKKEAKAELARIMQPFLIQNDMRTLETVRARLEGATAELVTIEEQQNPPLTIAAAWDAFLAATNRPDSGDATLRQYEFQFDRFRRWIAQDHPAAKAIRDVTRRTADEYAANLMGEGLSPNTFNKHVNLLQMVFRVLKEKARLAENPWETIQRKRLNGTGRRELTMDELRKVCAAATGELRTLLALGLYSGLRLGDCATLRWGEVDLHRGIIRRIPSKVARRRPTPVLIPIHSVLKAMLAETPTAKRTGYVLPDMAAAYARRPDEVTDLVQAHFRSCDISTQKPGTGFAKETGPDGKLRKVSTGKRAVVEVGFHSLRHTFVSLCREANAPLSVVEAIVGHSNPAMTRLYTHTSEAAAGAAVASLPDITRQAKPALPAPADIGTVPKASVRELAEKLTPKNVTEIRDALLALATT